MKKFSLLALAAAGLLLGACSDKNVVDEVTQEHFDAKGNGYVSMSVKLPTTTQSTTRAANDIYDDGLADEYAVKNIALIIFTGASESAATFNSVQDIAIPDVVNDVDNDNITTSYLATARVSNPGAGKDLFALVMLNYDNVLDVTNKQLKVDGTASNNVAMTDMTILDVQKLITAGDFKYTSSGKTYFFMSNAVLSGAVGGTIASTAPAKSNLSVLVQLDKDKIYPSEAEAKSNPAGSVFVERGLAKATLSSYPKTIGSGTGALPINSIEWTLDNTEPKSFLVRNMFEKVTDYSTSPFTYATIADYIGYSSEAFTTPNYRFVGHTKIGETSIQPTVDLYRTYWCVDPQYGLDNQTLNTAATHTFTTVASRGNSDADWTTVTANGTPMYCYENTFDVAHQLYKYTTRAIIKVTLRDGATFWTVNGSQDRLTSESDVQSYLKKSVIENSQIKKIFQDNLLSGTYNITDADFEFTFSTGAGKYELTSLTLSSTLEAKADNVTTFKSSLKNGGSYDDDGESSTPNINIDNVLEEAMDAANAAFTIQEYVGGVMYYEARFQHFANTADESVAGGTSLAPWNSWEPTGKKPTSSVAYPEGTSKTAEENYLGRYGMVRNNWYDVTITAFNKLGSPVDPGASISTDDTPDDHIDDYISLKINVLSWAKRTQQWSF